MGRLRIRWDQVVSPKPHNAPPLGFAVPLIRTYIRVMPDLSNFIHPVEWEISHAASKEPIALIRRLRLGAGRVLYYRAITWDADPSKRELIGYWGTLDEAAQNVYGLYERKLPKQFLASSGSTWKEPLPLTKPKMPPAG